jgi:putative hydrolase of the HAD superfamily
MHPSPLQSPVQPQVIFLDAVGTLFGIRGSVGKIYQHFAATAGVQVDADTLNQAFFQSFAAAPRAAFPGVPLAQIPQLEYHWWRAVAAQSFAQVGVFAQFADFDAFFQPLFAYFVTADPWELYAEVPQVLATWQAAGIHLGVLSNFDSRLHQVLQALEIQHFFSSVTISTQVGAAKPEPEIFAAALQEQQQQQWISHSISPSQVWHIGDSWSEDVVGAHAAGLTPIWLNRKQPLFASETSQEPMHVRTVSRLSELLPEPFQGTGAVLP